MDEALKAKVWGYKSDLKAIIFTEGKHARDAAMRTVRTKALDELLADTDAADKGSATKAIKNFYHDLQGEVERECILEGKRTDGRGHSDIRQITIDPNFAPRNHGSVLFTRGGTVSVRYRTPPGNSFCKSAASLSCSRPCVPCTEPDPKSTPRNRTRLGCCVVLAAYASLTLAWHHKSLRILPESRS